MKHSKKNKKEFLLRRANAIAQHERKRKVKRKIIVKRNVLLNIKQTHTSIVEKSKERINFVAPPVFSLLEDASSVNLLINQAGETLSKHIPANFDLNQVTVMGPETLVYYCALFNDTNYTRGTSLLGNLPLNEDLKKMFIESNFFNFVKSNKVYQAYSKDIYDGMIYRKSRVKVEPEIAGEVVRKAIKYTYESDNISKQRIYPIIIECMGNTFNHANYADKSEIYKWWLFAYKEPKTMITKFCFLDLGIGIFGSLNRKYEDKRLSGWFKGKIFPEDNAKTLKEIFGGKGKTSTGKPERGLGINNIYNIVVANSHIKNFTLISNDIFAKIDYNNGATINKLQHKFIGTLYYWEIIPKQ